ncbi:hypothetical protein ACEPAG_3136 [Sanghuangporus baumii]
MENVHGLVTLPPSSSGNPRSRRMGGILRPTSFPPLRLEEQKPITLPISPKDESLSMSSPSRTSPHPVPPPPPPPRSPLRPSPKSVSSFATLIDMYARRDTVTTLRMDNLNSGVNRRRSVASLSAALEQFALDTSIMPATPGSEIHACDTFSLSEEKPLPVPPKDDSPPGSPTATIGLNSIISEASTDATLSPSAPPVTKREHALKELLSSERSYASDLAFIQNVHIPLALGKQAPFQLPTPPSSSGSSSRTLSTSSASSSSSSHYGPPMGKDDARIIFGNITELAMFSEMFSERLQEALGDVLEDGKGEDWVGALFLEIVPQMEPPYMHYITKHPNAIKHLNSLPRTPALANYLTQTQNLASSVTHAWDLPSLLIKPVQRLLKYSLLLSTIIENTPDDHGDKENLKKARDRMEELAHKVNEGRRRIEVVKEVLAGKVETGKPTSLQKKISIGKAQVGVGRMKSIGASLRASRAKYERSNEESSRVAELEAQLRKCETFVRELAKDIVSWAQAVRASQMHLRAWAVDFGKTIGISEEKPSEAFNAFMDLIDMRLLPLCQVLDEMVGKELLPELGSLLDSSKSPLRLLSTMHSLEPLHIALLNLNYAKHRPTQTMLEASQKYMALRGQLASDLPRYLELFDKGVVMCIRRFARRQTDFWSTVRDEWSTLWDCLRMEGETNAGCEETFTLWWARYSEVEEAISKLNILKREKPFLNHVRSRMSGSSRSIDAFSMDSSTPYLTPLPNSPSSAFSGPSSGRHRSFGSLDSTISRDLRSSPSVESVPTLSSSSRGKNRPRTPDSLGRLKARSNTNPLPYSSSLQAFNIHTAYTPQGTSVREYAESIDSRSDIRGRKSRSSSLSMRLSETLRTPLRRSPSQKSVGSQRSQRSVPYNASHSSASFLVPDPDNDSEPPIPLELLPPPNSPSMYYVVANHPCCPPEGALYMDLPFFHLRQGEVFGVVSELGHPSLFEGLCMDIDEGEDDCLLVVRNEDGETGLALASFLVPVSDVQSGTAL